MSLKTISVDNAPKAIGPYAQGIVAGGFLFTAGQVGLDPATMKLVEGDVAAQTRRIFDNLEAVLAGAGATLSDVVRAGVFLVDMGDFAKMNEVFAARFGAHRPARSTVAVAALPAGARVEIDLVVCVG
ncbi:MAG TPA: Rid family detoxifying hydrolase [Thermoanaerobaculia bacterium]|nr:Rid family detoxifying hydrolase [Thermoanaerobaculia bacterium]